MNEVDREKISYSIGSQGSTRNENNDYKKFNHNEKILDKHQNDYGKNQNFNIPVWFLMIF